MYQFRGVEWNSIEREKQKNKRTIVERTKQFMKIK